MRLRRETVVACTLYVIDRKEQEQKQPLGYLYTGQIEMDIFI